MSRLLEFLPSLVFGILVSISVFFYFKLGPMKNNSDYVRVLGSVIQIDQGADNAACKAPQSLSFNGSSTMAIIFSSVAALVVNVFGFDCLTENSTFVALVLIYLLGLGIYLKRFGFTTEAALMILPYLVFPQLLKSYYEEAIILSLIPWMAIGLRNLFVSRKSGLFAISCVLFFYTKTQMIAVLPLALIALYLANRHGKRAWKNFAVALLITSSALLMNLSKSGFWTVNSYNRYFNGIGWSVQGVGDWPAFNYPDRQEYFRQNQIDLQKLTSGLEPMDGISLMGTTVWPEGMRFFLKSGIVMKPEYFQRFGLTAFLKTLVSSPDILLKLVKQSIKVTFLSDYNLNDLSSGLSSSEIYHYLKRPIAEWYGIIFFAHLLLFMNLKIKPSRWELLIATFYLALPLAIVLGDGYAEFEKHMVPFIMSSPLYVLLLRLARAKNREKAKAPYF